MGSRSNPKYFTNQKSLSQAATIDHVVKAARKPHRGQYQEELKQIWAEHLAMTKSNALDRRKGDCQV